MKKLQKAYYTKINFIDDIFENEKYLLKSILDKKILVIGGAGNYWFKLRERNIKI